jgi:DNA polymerase I-like protein with 3'-5' exonuclease and polymerase domains
MLYNSVHDEIDAPIPYIHRANGDIIIDEQYVRRIEEIMVEVLPLTVPLAVDVEIGPSWGEVEEWHAAN